MTPEELRSQVFACTHCEGAGLPFVRDPSDKFYRFPPTIGAVGRAPLLFIGINPRVSASNQHLHDAIVQDAVRFGELARNRVGATSYIGLPGLEQHYTLHVRVVRALYSAAYFEQVAAVTELHHCASSSSVGLPPDGSRCADRYLRSVLELVSPLVIFAVGKHVAKTLRRQFGSGRDVLTWSSGWAPVIELPHPNSRGPKHNGINAAVATARHHLQTDGTARASGARQSEQLPAPKTADVSRSSVKPASSSGRIPEWETTICGEANRETGTRPIRPGVAAPSDMHTIEGPDAGASTLQRGSQRAIMQRLFLEHGRDVERVVAAYADAERAGKAVRSSNSSKLSPERYARRLLNDGLRKGWLNERLVLSARRTSRST